MTDTSRLHVPFASILERRGIRDPIQSIEIEGIEDQPGLHWSNPGLKRVSGSVRNQRYRYVLKTLAEHSKREVLVYRFLSDVRDFPMPELHHSVFDPLANEYWILMEECPGREITRPQEFWEQVGILLARIHCAFWDRTDDLPEFFRRRPLATTLAEASRNLKDALGSFTPAERLVLENVLECSLDDIARQLARVDFDADSESDNAPRCLLHGAFHPPEIRWRLKAGEYEPVGVDWEQARIGAPGEDLRICITPLGQGDMESFDLLINTYLETMRARGIDLSRGELITSARREGLKHRMGIELPWILSRYLIVRSEDRFADWCAWFRENMPANVAFMTQEIEGELSHGTWLHTHAEQEEKADEHSKDEQE